MTYIVKFTFILLLILVAGCVMQSILQPIHIKGFIFRNQTSKTISMVEVRIPDTNEVAGCSNIPTGTSCSNSLPMRKFQDHLLTVSWSSGGKNFTFTDIVVHRPERFAQGKPVIAIMTFGDRNSFFVELVRTRNKQEAMTVGNCWNQSGFNSMLLQRKT